MRFFLFSDIDHTLLRFLHEAGIAYLYAHLQSCLDEKTSTSVKNFVDRTYSNFHARAKGETFDEKIMDLLKDATLFVRGREKASDLHWSRELWVWAALNMGEPILKTNIAVEAAAEYWRGIARYAQPLPDVREFFESDWWKNNPWELIPVTSSDARLRMDAKSGGLEYDPQYSTEKKRERIPVWLLDKSQNNFFPGDPIGKPNPVFWEEVFLNAGYNPAEDIAVMVGDSLISDLTNLEQYGVKRILRAENPQGENIGGIDYVIEDFEPMYIILEEIEKRRRQVQ